MGLYEDGFHSIFSLRQLEGITSPRCLLFCPPVSMAKDAMKPSIGIPRFDPYPVPTCTRNSTARHASQKWPWVHECFFGYACAHGHVWL